MARYGEIGHSDRSKRKEISSRHLSRSSSRYEDGDRSHSKHRRTSGNRSSSSSRSRSPRKHKKRKRSSSSSPSSSSSDRHQKSNKLKRKSSIKARGHSRDAKPKKIKKNKKDRERSPESSSSATSSSSDSSSSSEDRPRKKKHKKKEKKKSKKKHKKHKKKKLKKKKEKADNFLNCPIKNEELVKSDKVTSNTKAQETKHAEQAKEHDIRSFAPMTKEMWEKQQSVIRRVYDEDTGRTRLVRGDGEILEEIVSESRHKEINRIATAGDGASFQANLATKNLLPFRTNIPQ